MQRRIVLAFAVAALLHSVAMNCPAQQPTQSQDVMRGCSAAMGAIQGGTTFVMVATRESQGMQSTPVQIKISGLHRYREERTTNGAAEVAVVNGSHSKHQYGEKTSATSLHASLYFVPDQMPALNCSANLFPSGMRSEVLSDEIVAGRPVYHVRMFMDLNSQRSERKGIHALLSERHLYIDKSTLLILKTARRVFSPDAVQNSSLWEVYYSDYARIGATMVPFKIEMYLESRQVEMYRVSSVSTNVSLSDQEFE